MDLKITRDLVTQTLGIIVSLGGVGALVAKMTNPVRALLKRVEELELFKKKLEDSIDQLTEQESALRADIKSSNEVLVLATLALIDHQLTESNNTETLEGAREKIRQYLVQK